MNRIYLTLGLLASLGSGVQAQTTSLQANIPFDFQIGKVQMPAGQYELKSRTHALWLYETRTRKSAIVMTVPASRSETPEKGVIKFNRYGDEYFFAGAWAPEASVGSTVPKSAREKELASRRVEASPTAVALRK